jgi:hypothetical protein
MSNIQKNKLQAKSFSGADTTRRLARERFDQESFTDKLWPVLHLDARIVCLRERRTEAPARQSLIEVFFAFRLADEN